MNGRSAGNEDLINKFTEFNESILETAQFYNVPYGTMWARLKKAGVKSRKKKPVYSNTLNKEYFYNIDSSTKAYFLGLIKADGYIDKKRNRLAIRLQEKDVDILKRFCDAVNLPIKRINYLRTKDNQSTHVEIAITNRKFITPIIDIKDNFKFKIISKEFIYDFIRGYFDGDGGVYYHNIDKKKFSMSIMGSPDDDSILKFIKLFFPDVKEHIDKRSNLPYLKTNKHSLLLEFRDKVYGNCHLYMIRKKEKFDKIKFWLTEPQRLYVEHPNKDEDIV